MALASSTLNQEHNLLMGTWTRFFSNCLTIMGFVTGIASTSIAFARGPGEAGGGGNLVHLGANRFELLDLYIFRAEHPEWSSQMLSSVGHQLPSTRALQEIHVERLNNANFPVVDSLKQKLSHPRWKAQGLGELFETIQLALQNAPIFYTEYRINARDKSPWIPPFLRKTLFLENLLPVALYAQGWGILVSKSDFEALDDRNQMALLLHEVLRHVQIFYKYDMTDQALQTITAAVVLDYPSIPREITLEVRKTVEGDRSTFTAAKQYNLHLKGLCAALRGLHASLREELQSEIQTICLAPQLKGEMTFEAGMALNDSVRVATKRISNLFLDQLKAHLEKYMEDIEREMARPRAQRRGIKGITTDPNVQKSLELIAAVSTDIFEWSGMHPQLRIATNKLKDVTLSLEHFDLDVAIKYSNRAIPLPQSQMVQQLFENLLRQGTLLK
jgi:hypothetical protein